MLSEVFASQAISDDASPPRQIGIEHIKLDNRHPFARKPNHWMWLLVSGIIMCYLKIRIVEISCGQIDIVNCTPNLFLLIKQMKLRIAECNNKKKLHLWN
jgi:hypothetical protein